MHAFKLRLVTYVVLLALLPLVALGTGSVAAVAPTVALVAALAYVLARSVATDVAARVEARGEQLAAERARVQRAMTRLGDALAASHDPYALLPFVLETAVEATGAVGGRLLVDGREVASSGDTDAARALEIPLDGEDGVLLLMADGEFGEHERELAQWLGSQASIVLENARLHRKVERQAVTDGLTELPNRHQFEESLAGEIGRVDRFGGSLSLILADLDDFKQVNDRYGHQAGDVVLRTFADVLQANVRAIDLPARWGGEEFAVLLPQTGVQGAERLAERLRQAVAARPIEATSGTLVAITASFGVASYPAAPSQAALVAAADEGLYTAKRNGKNGVAVSDVAAVHAEP